MEHTKSVHASTSKRPRIKPSELDDFDRYGLIDIETALAAQLHASDLQKISYTSSGQIRTVRVRRNAVLVAATIRTLAEVWNSPNASEFHAREHELRPVWAAHMKGSGSKVTLRSASQVSTPQSYFGS